ncbi:cupin domain-containing protein [Coraliomargarita akajimensis]|uniref:Cupin 2 conserved barrel domain protein n=1 Tax=Coraliomargarita akajimensis (strain DSM 45221 / IAM 15411 / JCM 23193 / KCTC 12865 / 04OKA010-24) TaxID=583355 RepID=D5EMT7_CORAD|nr:cupin domain-containing protein [Coraliomargarita akajimensis]ADE55327.1 Cupin 2 conserved barrel domain protein [Coraliomargarita akajimensis DSM 45221]
MPQIPSITKLFTSTGATEVLNELLRTQSAKLEHIVSNGEASPADFWYDQTQDEWVALIQGTATLEFESGSLALQAGDSLVIPAHLRHRVAHVSQDAVWIAVHYTAI